LLDIINDVLDMSKIEAGKVNLMETEVAVDDVMRSVGRIMLPRAQAAQVGLRTDIPADLPFIKGDQRLLRQILINLVSNAVKFSPPGTDVAVSARISNDNSLVIEIADHGAGIPEDKLRYVMEPFGQVGDPRSYKGQGTGLGLPLAKAMVELHDGHISLSSREGMGTTVTMSFPAFRVIPAKAIPLE